MLLLSAESASIPASVAPSAGMVLVTRATVSTKDKATKTQVPTSETERQGTSGVFCIECSIIPSSHRCHRCKHYVANAGVPPNKVSRWYGGVAPALNRKASQHITRFGMETTILTAVQVAKKIMLKNLVGVVD